MIFPLMTLVFGSCFAIGNENDTNHDGREGKVFIGGSKLVSIQEAPFVVALVKNESRDSTVVVPFCSGSIITEEWVLSAAHCISKIVPVTLFQVIAGCDTALSLYWNYTGRDRKLKQTRWPIDWKLHPQYQYKAAASHGNPDTPNTYDVLLIRVEPFKFGEGVARIDLWTREWEGVKVKNHGNSLMEECSVYGWGQKEPDKPSHNLRTARFQVFHGAGGCKCVSGDRIHRLICSEPVNEVSLCPGDGGGPLVCQKNLTGVSYSIYRCGQTGTIAHPSNCGGRDIVSSWIYTCPMVQWIHEIAPAVPPAPISCRSSLICSPSLLIEFLLEHIFLLILL